MSAVVHPLVVVVVPFFHALYALGRPARDCKAYRSQIGQNQRIAEHSVRRAVAQQRICAKAWILGSARHVSLRSEEELLVTACSEK